jgi:membrane protease subunit HflK
VVRRRWRWRRRRSKSLLLVIAGGALLVWGLMGFYQIDEQERAVVLRFGKYHAIAGPGLQWNPPLIDEVIRVNTTKVRAASFREIMLTQDENIVEVRMSVQYLIDDVKNFVLRSASRKTPCSTRRRARCVTWSAV